MARGRKKIEGPVDEDDLVFKALASSERRLILDLLKDTPMTTGEIGKHFADLDRTTVMQHLGVLEKARLVISKKEGRCRWNYLDVAPIQRIHERWIESYALPSVKLLSRIHRDLGA